MTPLSDSILKTENAYLRGRLQQTRELLLSLGRPNIVNNQYCFCRYQSLAYWERETEHEEKCQRVRKFLREEEEAL